MGIKYFTLSFISFFIYINLYSQNTGIGTTAPLEKLHVEGNIKADTIKPNRILLTPNAGIGKILTSDAVGNASWQTGDAGATSGNLGYGVWGDCATNGNISGYQPVTDTGFSFSRFGNSVSVSGDYAVVGVPNDVSGGHACVFQFDGTKWIFMEKITDATGSPGDGFGSSVAIDGSYIIVGAPYDNVGSFFDQGSASIFQLSGNNWVLMNKITFSAGDAFDLFGHSVAISGTYAVVGAPYDDIFVADQGSATVYRFDGNNWVQMINLSDAALGGATDFFGISVSISGEYIVVGVPRGDEPGQTDRGHANIYQYTPSNWTFVKKLLEIGGDADYNFGSSVSISGEYVVVGSPLADVSSSLERGAATVFRNNNNTWPVVTTFHDPNATANDWIGCSVCISGDYIIVGAIGDMIHPPDIQQGSAYI